MFTDDYICSWRGGVKNSLLIEDFMNIYLAVTVSFYLTLDLEITNCIQCARVQVIFLNSKSKWQKSFMNGSFRYDFLIIKQFRTLTCKRNKSFHGYLTITSYKILLTGKINTK